MFWFASMLSFVMNKYFALLNNFVVMNESFSSSKTAYMLFILKRVTRYFRSANRDDSKKDIIQWFITFSLADTMYEKYWHHGEQMFFEALHFCAASKKICWWNNLVRDTYYIQIFVFIHNSKLRFALHQWLSLHQSNTILKLIFIVLSIHLR